MDRLPVSPQSEPGPRLQADAPLTAGEVGHQEMLLRLFEAAPDALSMTEIPSGRVVLCNEAFLRLTGFSREEVMSTTTLAMGVWHVPNDRAELLRRLRVEGIVKDHPATLHARDGRLSSVMLSASCFQADGRTYMVTHVRDITATERERLINRAIPENASIGIAYTRDRTFQAANPCFEAMFGWEPGGLVGQPGSVVWPGEAAYRAFGEFAGARLSRFEPVDQEFLMRRRDGGVFPARVCAKAIDPSHPTQGGTIWIVEDVTERRRVELALARAKEQAEAANRAKSAFLANTSHEIRTPLNAVVGLARLALEPGVTPERQRDYLHHIATAADNLSAIISDILDLSKIEAGKLTVEQVPFDLFALLSALYDSHRPLAAAKGLSLRGAWPHDTGPSCRVIGDPTRLKQVLSNYLSNALKFTPRGEVVLMAEPLGAARWRLGVRDTGIGMDELTQVHVFDAFFQADTSTTRRYGGTGLGLAICGELAALMGGSVGVQSAPGQGSWFWLELDLPAAVPTQDGASHPATPDGHASPGGLAGTRVLLVEDNAVNVLVAQAMLESWGVNVTVAQDGRQALAAVDAAAQPFHAVLMDVQMPGMDGHEATQALRARYGTHELPVIALTADVLTSERDHALAIGMNDFVAKPIDAQRLRDVLLRWVSRPAPEQPPAP